MVGVKSPETLSRSTLLEIGDDQAVDVLVRREDAPFAATAATPTPSESFIRTVFGRMFRIPLIVETA